MKKKTPTPKKKVPTAGQVRSMLAVVEARLNGDPADRADWTTIVVQLRAVTRLAEQCREAAPEVPGAAPALHHVDCNCEDCRYDRASDAPIPGWSDFCEAQGTRCTYTARGTRCDEGVTKGDRCAKHQRPETYPTRHRSGRVVNVTIPEND